MQSFEEFRSKPEYYNRAVKLFASPAVFLPTFATVGKSRSEASEARAET